MLQTKKKAKTSANKKNNGYASYHNGYKKNYTLVKQDNTRVYNKTAETAANKKTGEAIPLDIDIFGNKNNYILVQSDKTKVYNNKPEIFESLKQKENRPTVKEAAIMAAHVYGDKDDSILEETGWQVSETIEGVNDPDTGLKALVYEKWLNNKVIAYACSFAGTEIDQWEWFGKKDLKDLKADITQPFGESEQYTAAMDFAKKVKQQSQKTPLTFIGHSLGGGQASLAAMVTGESALTFNAAGVSMITEVKEGGREAFHKQDNGDINAYIMDGDPLNSLQNSWILGGLFMPDVDGNRHYLQTPKDNLIDKYLDGHSIDTVLEKFGINPNQYKNEK